MGKETDMSVVHDELVIDFEQHVARRCNWSMTLKVEAPCLRCLVEPRVAMARVH